MNRRYLPGQSLDIDPTVVKTWFRLDTDMRQVLLGDGCMSIEITRKGNNAVLATYSAFSTDLEGNVSFYWDDSFLALPPGFYLGDVFFGATYCFTAAFRIRRCRVGATLANQHEAVGNMACDDSIGAAGIPSGCEVTPYVPPDAIIHATPIHGVCAPMPDDVCAPYGVIPRGEIGSNVIGPGTLGGAV